MARYLVFPFNGKWVVRKSRAKRASHTSELRRDAIDMAKVLAGKNGVVTVHNSAGLVVIRIPEV